MTVSKSPLVCGVPDIFCVNTVTAHLYLINKCNHVAILLHLMSFLKLSFNLCNRMKILSA